MNRRQLTWMIVFAAAFAVIGIYFARHDKSSYTASTARMGEKLLPKFPLNETAQITVRQESEMNLLKKGDRWVVRERGDYPANFSDISELLRKLWDLKVTQPVRVSAPSSLGRLGLATGKGSNSVTVAEFKDASGKVLSMLALGKKHQRDSAADSQFGGFADGRYVMVGNDLKSVALISDPLNNLEIKPENWLEKDFFKIEKVRAISLVSTNATNSWKLTRESETNDWKLAQAAPTEQLDVNKVAGVANALANPSFVDVVPNPKPEETGMDKPVVATFETFDGFVYTIKVGRKSGDENYFMTMSVSGQFGKERNPGKDEKPEEKDRLDKEFKERTSKLEEKLKREKEYEKWTYTVAKWTIDPFLRDRAQLLVEKKEEKPAPVSPELPKENNDK